jgi:hypothetical protein
MFKPYRRKPEDCRAVLISADNLNEVAAYLNENACETQVVRNLMTNESWLICEGQYGKLPAKRVSVGKYLVLYEDGNSTILDTHEFESMFEETSED